MEIKIKTRTGFIQHHFLWVGLKSVLTRKSKQDSVVSANSIKSGAGFTLIELLVVISIIGLLASVLIVSVSNARQKGRDAKRVGDLNQMLKAFELFFNNNNSYPTSASSVPLSQLTGLTPTYLITMPTTVLPADGNCAAGPGAGTNDYWFYANGGATYGVTFCLGTDLANLKKGPHTITQGGFQ